MQIEPQQKLGVEIAQLDVKLAKAAELRDVLDFVYKKKLVVIRGQSLDRAEYVAFARRLGTPQIYFQDNYHHPEYPEIFVSSNVEENGEKVGVRGTGRYWHTDYQFMPQPLPLTMLMPWVLPPGRRATYYIDTGRVLRELPVSLRRMVEDRRAIHDGKYRYKVQPSDIDVSIAEIFEQAKSVAPPQAHPAIIEHPITGEKLLYVSRGFTTGLEGLSHEVSGSTLEAIFDFMEQERFVVEQRWEKGDVILWDNRQLLHMASTVEPGQSSTSYRIGIYDHVPFYVGLEPVAEAS